MATSKSTSSNNEQIRAKVQEWMEKNKTTAISQESPNPEHLKKYLREQNMDESQINYGVGYYEVVVLPFGVK